MDVSDVIETFAFSYCIAVGYRVIFQMDMGWAPCIINGIQCLSDLTISFSPLIFVISEECGKLA